MTASVPTIEPLSARAGDTWKWTRTFADYPASAWTLKYQFKHPTLAGFTFTATASGDDFSISVAAATTAAFAAGSYSWVCWAETPTTATEKHTLDTGQMTVDPDLRAGTSTAILDDRSHARKMFDAIETWLETKDPAVAEYEIAGRRMKYIPIAELVKLHNNYKLQVEAEDNANKLRRGEGAGRKIQFRI